MQRDHMRRIASGILLILALMLMQGIMAVPQASAAASAQLNYGAADLVFVMGMNSELKNKDGSFSRYDAAALIAGMCDPETSRAAILKAFYDGTLTTWPIPDQGEFKALKDGGLAELHAELSRMRTFNYYGKSVNLTDGVNQGLRMLLGRKNPAAAPVMLIIADAYSTLDMEKTSRVLTQASGSECTVHVMYLENGPDGETRGYLERVASDTDGHFLLIRSANEFTGKALDIMTEKLRGGRVSFSNDVVVRAGGQTETLITLKSAVASSVYVYVDKLMEAMGQASLFDVKLLPVSGRPGMPSQKAKQIYDGNACALFEVNSSLPGMEWVLSAGSSREIARGELRVVALYDQSGLQLQAGLNEQEKITVSKDEEFILGAAIAADGAILPPRQYGDVGMRAEIWPSQSVPGRTDTIRIDLNRKDGSYEARLCFNDLGLTKPGEYSVQVTAEGEGVRLASSVLTFNAVNKAPVPVREGDASLQIIHPSITSILQEDAKSITIDVAELFDSPDGDELTYDLKTSGGALVNCVLDTNILTVTANRVVGSTVITITATDLLHNDAQCEASVKVNVSALPLVQGLMKYAEIRLEMDNTTFLPGEEMVMNVFLENRYFRGERFSTRDCYEAILDGVQLSVRDSSGAVSGIIHHIPEGTPCFRGAHRIAAGPDTYVFSAGAVIGGNTLPSRSTQPYKVRAPISFVIHSQAARFGGPGEKRTVSLSESFEADELEYDYFLDDKTLLRITQDEYMLTLEPRGRAGREVITVKARDKVSGIEQFACIPVDISMKPLSESLGGLARLEMKVESLDRMLAEPDMIECTVRLVNREDGIPYTDPECYRAVGAENLSLTATTGGAPESFDLVLSPEGTYFTGTYSLKGVPGTYIFKAAGASGGKRFEEVQHTLRVHPKVLLRMEHPLAGYTGEYPKDVLNFVQDAALPEGMETAYDPQPMKPDLLRLELMGSVLTIQAVGTEGFTQVHVFRTSEGVTRLAAIIPVEIAFKPLGESLSAFAEFDLFIAPANKTTAMIDRLDYQVYLRNEKGIRYTNPACYAEVEGLAVTVQPSGSAVRATSPELRSEPSMFEGSFNTGGEKNTYIFTVSGKIGGIDLTEKKQLCKVSDEQIIHIEHQMAGDTEPRKILEIRYDEVLENPEKKDLVYSAEADRTLVSFEALEGSHDGFRIMSRGHDGSTLVTVTGESGDGWKSVTVIPVTVKQNSLAASLSTSAEPAILLPAGPQPKDRDSKVGFSMALKNKRNNTVYTDPECYQAIEEAIITLTRTGPLGDVNPQVLQWAYRGNKGEFIVKSDPYQDGAMLADVSMGPSGVSGTVITGRKSGHYSLTCSVSINGKWIEGINAAFYVQNSPPKPADEAVNLTFTIPPGRIPEDWLLMADVLHGFLAGTPVEHGTTLEPSKYFSDPDAHDVLRYSVSGVSGGDGSPIAYEQGSMNLKFLGEGVGTIYLNAEDSDGSMATKGINILLTSASVLAWKTILVCSLIILAALFVLWMLVRLVVWPFKPSWKQNRDLEVFVNELYEGAVVMPALGKKPLRYRVKDRKMIAGDAVASKSENPFIKILEAAPLVNSDAKPALRSVLKGMTFTPGNKQSLIIKPGSVRRGQLPESGDVEFYINNKQKGRGKRIRFRRGEFKAAYKQGGKILGSVSFLFANDSLSRRNSRV